MAKAKHSSPIDCERCRNFAGNAFWLRFACTKGYTDKDEAHYLSLQRRSCADYDPASRAELIFSRRKSSFSGGELMMKDAKTVKRTATTLRNLINEEALGHYLSAKELEHFRAAIGALDALAPDLTRAAKLGDQYQAQQHALYKARHEEAMQRLVAEKLPDATPETLMQVVDDLHRFSRNWRGTPSSPGAEPVRAAVYLSEGDAILRALAACRKALTPASLKALTVELGALVEQMCDRDFVRIDTGGWRDFLQYRKTLAVQRAIVEGVELPPSDAAPGAKS